MHQVSRLLLHLVTSTCTIGKDQPAAAACLFIVQVRISFKLSKDHDLLLHDHRHLLICLPKLQIQHHGAPGASSAELQIQHKSGFGKQDEFFVHTHQVQNLPTITEACLRFRIQGLRFRGLGFRV